MQVYLISSYFTGEDRVSQQGCESTNLSQPTGRRESANRKARVSQLEGASQPTRVVRVRQLVASQPPRSRAIRPGRESAPRRPTQKPRPTQTCQFRHADLSLLSSRWDLFSFFEEALRRSPAAESSAAVRHSLSPADTVLGAGRHGTWRRPTRHLAPADKCGRLPRPTRTLSNSISPVHHNLSAFNDDIHLAYEKR